MIDTTNTESTQINTVGFKNKEDILDEINYRLSLINRFNIYLKKIPSSLTRSSMKELVPEMVTCRYPEQSRDGHKNYAFLQFLNETAVNKYVDILNNKVVYGKKLVATKLQPISKYTSLENFDLKQLYFNGLKPETKFHELKQLYPNAKIFFPTDVDKTCLGSVNLTFNTEAEALTAFIENKLNLHNIKSQLVFVMIKKTKVNVEKPISYTDEELFAEIISRLESQNNRSVMVKNLPAKFTLADLKKITPTLRNCKICTEKKIGFVDFDNHDLAVEAVKILNNKQVTDKKIRAFIPKKAVQFSDLTSFNMAKLHITNLSMDVTVDDIKSIFPNCEIDLNMNTDNTCIGNATLTFNNQEEVIKYFNKKEIQVRGVVADINFHIESKTSETVSKKRPLAKSDDEEPMETEIVKKSKIEVNGKSMPRKSLIAQPIKKQINKNKAVNKKEENCITQQVQINLSPVVIENDGIVEITSQKKVTRQETEILKSVNIKKAAEKKTEEQTKKVVKKTSDNKDMKKSEEKMKIVKSSIVKKNEVINKKTVMKKEVKPEITTKITATKAGKRKFDQVETEDVEEPIKKSRVVAKQAVKGKVVDKVQKMGLRSQENKIRK